MASSWLCLHMGFPLCAYSCVSVCVHLSLSYKDTSQFGLGSKYRASQMLSGKESTCQCRLHRFDPWDGKILWRKKWQPIPVSLSGEVHGQRSPVGYSPWGLKKSDTTEGLTRHATYMTSFKP